MTKTDALKQYKRWLLINWPIEAVVYKNTNDGFSNYSRRSLQNKNKN